MKKVLVFIIGWLALIISPNALATDSRPQIYIKSINPGYTIDGVANTGEMIEIARKEFTTSISLAGATVGYTNSSGNYSVLFEFPENSWMTGEVILLRLASSPGAELANANYTKTLAFKAGISLKYGDEVIDEVCWNGKDGCYTEFKSGKPTSLVKNLDSNLFEHVEEYEPKYDKNNYYVEELKEEDKVLPSQCSTMEFSEILSYYDNSKNEQFIELHNFGAEQVLLDGCKIRYKNKNYDLKGIVRADGYFVFYPSDFSLTKNPANYNILELIDTNGDIVDGVKYPNGQRKGATYALIGYDEKGFEIWRVTYAVTPGMSNVFQEFKTCEEGKVINEATGNCVKKVKITTKVCAEGQYLNILTGRCKKYETSSTKICKEGYYLNPETNRCRKIKENNGADYGLQPEDYKEESHFVALYAVVGVLVAGAVYVIFEFRKEIAKLFGKVFRRRC